MKQLHITRVVRLQKDYTETPEFPIKTLYCTAVPSLTKELPSDVTIHTINPAIMRSFLL